MSMYRLEPVCIFGLYTYNTTLMKLKLKHFNTESNTIKVQPQSTNTWKARY